MKKIIGFLFLTFIFGQSAYAFDEKRKGFLVSVGAGIHSVSVEDSFGLSSEEMSKTGLATSFKLGGGLTDNFVLYYVRNASWYNDSYLYNAGVAGIGSAIYFKSSSPSLYLHGGFGVGDLSAPLELTTIEAETGKGFLLGAGYEFGNRVTVEGTYMAGDVDVAEISSFQLLVNYQWY